MSKNKKIIAIIGMAGSGKSEVIDYLQKKFNWPKIYFGAITFEELKKAGMEVNYENEKIMREKLREKFGPGAYAELSLLKIKKDLLKNKTILIESLYSWAEYKIIKQKYKNDFIAIAVYASPNTRFVRLQKRKNWRPIKDEKTFKNRDYTEIEGTDKGGPIAIADYTIINEGSKNELKKNIDKAIKKIYK